MTLENAFGTSFNADAVRTRTFTLNGNQFKVKVPLTAEIEALYERVKVVDESKVAKYYADLSKEFFDNKDKYEGDPDIEIKDADIFIKGRSLLDTARSKVITENRITEMVRLLVPEDKDFDMSKVSYEDIDALFPFGVQLELIDEINSVIAPSYAANKKK